MGTYHVLGVSEDDLKPWHGRRRALEAHIGRRVVAMCLDGIDPFDNSPGAPSLDHLADTDFSVQQPNCRLWMWEVGDSVCMADLSKEDVDLAIRMAFAVQRDLEQRKVADEKGGQGSSASTED